MTWWQKRGCEQVPREMGVVSNREMLPGTWLQGSLKRHRNFLVTSEAIGKFVLRKCWAESPLSDGMAKFPIALESDRTVFLREYYTESEFPMRAPLGRYNIIRGGRCIGNSQVGIKSNIVLGPRCLTGRSNKCRALRGRHFLIQGVDRRQAFFCKPPPSVFFFCSFL